MKARLGNRDLEALYGNRDLEVVYGNRDLDALYGNRDLEALYGNRDLEALYGNRDLEALYGNRDLEALYGDQGLEALYRVVAWRQVSSISPLFIEQNVKTFPLYHCLHKNVSVPILCSFISYQRLLSFMTAVQHKIRHAICFPVK